MRFTRIGATAASVALGASIALAGAGAAQAAPFAPAQLTDTGSTATLNSKSTLNVTASGTSAKVTYTNKSGKSLSCLGYSGPDYYIDILTGFAKDPIKMQGYEPSEAEQIRLGADAAAGKVHMLLGDGKAVKLTETEIDTDEFGDEPAGAPIDNGKTATWTVSVPAGFKPSVGILCFDPSAFAGGIPTDLEAPLADVYAEYLTGKAGTGILPGGATGGGEGSLDSLTGSLGS